MNADKLRGKMAEKRVTVTGLSTLLDMSETTFWRKANSKSEFTRDEIEKISGILHLENSELLEIFFSPELTETQVS